jgi:hypothetical protein
MTATPALTLKDVARRQSVCPRTVKNWVVAGVAGVRLRAWKAGKNWRTSEEALAEFLDALTGTVPENGPPPPSPAARSRAHEAAKEYLRQEGVL